MQLQQGALALSEMLPMVFTVFVMHVVQTKVMFELADICTYTELWVTSGDCGLHQVTVVYIR